MTTNSRRGFVVAAPAVKHAIHAAIDAEVETSHEDVPVSYGYPTGGLQPEHIWIGGAFNAATPRYVSGGLQRDEAGEVEVFVSVVWRDPDMTEAEDRAVVLSQLVEDAVSTDPTLGGTVQEAHVAGVQGDVATPDDHSLQYGLVLKVAYQTTVVLA